MNLPTPNPAALADLAPSVTPPPSPPQTPSVRSDGGAGSAGDGTWYRVQVGAFRQRDGAVYTVEQLAAAGFEAIIVPGGDLYRVQVGAFRDEERARNLVAQLKEKGFEAIVTR